MASDARMNCTQVEVSSLRQQGQCERAAQLSSTECIEAVWQLTLDAWSFNDPELAHSRLQRHVVRVIRGRG